MERIDTDTLPFSCLNAGTDPLKLPLGELSQKVTQRVLQPSIPSPSSLRSATSPKGRGKGDSYGTPTAAGDSLPLSDIPVVGGESLSLIHI